MLIKQCQRRFVSNTKILRLSHLETPGQQRKRTGPTRIGIPKFRLPLKPRSIPEGFGCILVCSVVGVPEPTVKWIKDGKPLTGTNYKTKVSMAPPLAIYLCKLFGFMQSFLQFDNGVCQLSIDKVRKLDGGDYVCVAENFKGQAKTFASLIVTSESNGALSRTRVTC